ncbi:uncharacterized protein [Parasteatoda tepidariorum]|uniref:uncharacterized protein n=1 Tax=Parasteatoda tepidariorum TaxID=114398 RepID=UPI001C724D1A|nr:uncharacterized protein LOC107443114 [Parasteatoda tepidariorum]
MMGDTQLLVDAVSKTCEGNNTIETYETKSNDASVGALNGPKICTFFSKYKNCRYGRNCKYKHYQQSPEHLFLENKGNKNIGFPDRIFVSKNNSSRTSLQTLSDRKFITKKVVCRYYKAGNCGKGDHCLYQHSSEITQLSKEVAEISLNAIAKKRRVPICHYFKKGKCHRGEDCKFYHQNAVKNVEGVQEMSSNDNNEKGENNVDYVDVSASEETTSIMAAFSTIEAIDVVKCQYVPHKISHGRKLHDLSNLSVHELAKIRDTEITQLKKRYPKHVASEQQSILITFEPSDPDWPFDLKSLDLEVYFPDKYPIEACKITVVLSSNNIPDMLIRYLNQSIKNWIEKRFEEVKCSSQTELMFRPFLKWFDRNLEELFICGLRMVKRDIEAKKNGIDFVPVEKLFCSTNDTHNSDSAEIVPEASAEYNLDSSEFQTKDDIIDNQTKNFSKSSILLDNSALRQGIKVLFNGLELVEGIATFSCSKLSITVHCIRCKTSCNIKCSTGKSSSSKCSKCSKAIECSFSPSMMHQFSNVAGNLHLVECQIVDINLVESCFVLDCLNCSKHITIDGLHYGQKQKRWCTSCNEKLIFSIENVKFQATSSTYIAAKNAPTKKMEKRKDPLFKEGEPLPDFGTCKHYKKSYRWLRFPCCGRLYPCDICHDEKENDHEMKFASRMICGFCSKEQPYSKEKPCSSCSGSMTSKSGAHWEGGKGCRNKIKMAKDDKHKYSGTSKTVSKKAQSTKSGKK